MIGITQEREAPYLVYAVKVRLENGWISKQMIFKEGEAAIPLQTTRRAFLNQEKPKQRSAIVLLEYQSGHSIPK